MGKVDDARALLRLERKIEALRERLFLLEAERKVLLERLGTP